MFDPFFSNYDYLLSLPAHPFFSTSQIIRSSNLEALNKVVCVRDIRFWAFWLLINVKHVFMWLLENLFYIQDIYINCNF